MGVLDGKVAIVTGSARGIGRATAELLSEQGAQVLINDLDADVAEQTASEIAGETVVYGGDLTAPGACDELVQTAIDAWGKIDIIVNNAGYTIDGAIHKMSDDAFQRMLDIHTIVPFRVIRAAAPHLREPAKKEREQGVEVFRKIVNVSSISGTMGNAGQANYAAGKAAVVGLTKTLAKEWGQFKINVNAVAFGFIDTRLTQAKVDDNIDADRRRDRPARHPRADARDGQLRHPARPPGHAGGGGRRRVLPLLAVVELRPRADAERHRRAVHRHDDVGAGAPRLARRRVRSWGSSRSCWEARARRSGRSCAPSWRPRGSILIEEGLSGSVRYTKFRAPGKYFDGKIVPQTMCLAISEQRLVVYGHSGRVKLVDAAFDNPRLGMLDVSLKDDGPAGDPRRLRQGRRAEGLRPGHDRREEPERGGDRRGAAARDCRRAADAPGLDTRTSERRTSVLRASDHLIWE